MWLFSDFQYDFRSSQSTADFLTVKLDKIARAFNRVWNAGLLHKLKPYGLFGQTFDLTSSFLSNRRLGVVLDAKSSQEYPVNAGVPQGSIRGPTRFLLHINDLLDDVICNIAMLMILLSTLSVFRLLICGKNYNWFLNFNLIYETLRTGARSDLLISMLEKLNWFRLTVLITLVLLISKWMGLFSRKIIF